jgi:hypothetical protein
VGVSESAAVVESARMRESSARPNVGRPSRVRCQRAPEGRAVGALASTIQRQLATPESNFLQSRRWLDDDDNDHVAQSNWRLAAF